jgi:hypothetical protein
MLHRLVQTPIDINQRVCNAIHDSSRGVRRHQTKKTSAVVRRRKITPQLLLTKQGEIIETPTQEGEGKTEREVRERSTKLNIDFMGFLCYGEVIISLPKTAKADAEERCKHHTWNHHFELQTSQSKEPISIQPHCRKKGILTLEFIDCTNAQMR